MRGIVAGDVAIVVGQIGTDGLGMHALKIVVCLAVGRDHQIKIARAHVQGAQSLAHDGVRSRQRVGGQHGLVLRAVAVHDLEPADKLFGLLAVDDVWAVHQRGRVQGRGGIAFVGRNDQTEILPVVEISRAVAAHAPVPDILGGIGVLLVFSVPIIKAVQKHDRAAVCLNPFAIGVQPYLPGANTCVVRRFLHENLLADAFFLL